MKRISALLLALTLVLGLALPAAAEIAQVEQGPVGITERFSAQVKEDAVGERSSSRFPAPLDTVSIKDGIITITSLDVTIELQVPFGWIGLTQDIAQQMTDYAMMIDPLGVLNYLIESRTSLLAVEPQTNTNLLVFFVYDGFSALIGELDTQEMLDVVVATYAGEAVSAGGRNYISVLEDGTLIFLTFHQGVRIGFQLLLAGEEPTEEDIELLTEFVSTVNYI